MSLRRAKFENRKFLMVQVEFCKIIDVVGRKICFLGVSIGNVGLRAYPNNPLYCGRLQSPMPALSAKNVLSVEKTTLPSIFGLPPWPRTFRSAS